MNTNDYLVYDCNNNTFRIMSIHIDYDVYSEIVTQLQHSNFEFLPLLDNHNITTTITITT